MNPKGIGEISEAQVLARLLLNGEIVLKPFGDNQRYDFVIDRNGRFDRIQVKTGKVINGAVRFYTSSTKQGQLKQIYVGQVEFFMVYCPCNQSIYKIPIDVIGNKKEFSLRIENTKNNQHKGLYWAVDFIY